MHEPAQPLTAAAELHRPADALLPNPAREGAWIEAPRGFGGVFEAALGIDRDRALAAVREFIATFGAWPTAECWTAAPMTPNEKTIRGRIGIFNTATDAAARGRP